LSAWNFSFVRFSDRHGRDSAIAGFENYDPGPAEASTTDCSSVACRPETVDRITEHMGGAALTAVE